MVDKSEKAIITLKKKTPREIAAEIFGEEAIYGVGHSANRIVIVLRRKGLLTEAEKTLIEKAFPKFKIHKAYTKKGRLEIER